MPDMPICAIDAAGYGDIAIQKSSTPSCTGFHKPFGGSQLSLTRHAGLLDFQAVHHVHRHACGFDLRMYQDMIGSRLPNTRTLKDNLHTPHRQPQPEPPFGARSSAAMEHHYEADGKLFILDKVELIPCERWSQASSKWCRDLTCSVSRADVKLWPRRRAHEDQHKARRRPYA